MEEEEDESGEMLLDAGCDTTTTSSRPSTDKMSIY